MVTGPTKCAAGGVVSEEGIRPRRGTISYPAVVTKQAIVFVSWQPSSIRGRDRSCHWSVVTLVVVGIVVVVRARRKVVG